MKKEIKYDEEFILDRGKDAYHKNRYYICKIAFDYISEAKLIIVGKPLK